jgi:predicted Zn-dependent protease
MRRTRHSRSSGREHAIDEFFGTEGLEAEPLPRQPDASFPLRPFAASATPDARIDAPSAEPMDPERVYQRALEAAAQSRGIEADALFRELLALEPAHVGGALGLAGLLESQQDVPAALGVLNAGLALHTDNADLLLARAGVRRRRKDLIDAESDVRRVLRANPANPNGLMELGLVLLRKGLAAEAGQVLMRRVEQQPDDAATWLYIGEARNQAGNLPAALEALKKSATLDERNDRVYYLMGRVLDRMGRPDEAMPMYRRSKELSTP